MLHIVKIPNNEGDINNMRKFILGLSFLGFGDIGFLIVFTYTLFHQSIINGNEGWLINLIANDTLIPVVVFFVMDNNRNNNLHAGLMDFIIDVTVKDPVSNPSISRHLDILKKAELVTCRRQGKYVIYSLNISLLQKLSMEILSFCDRKKDA